MTRSLFVFRIYPKTVQKVTLNDTSRRRLMSEANKQSEVKDLSKTHRLSYLERFQ